MEIKLNDPFVKEITFDTFEKFFFNMLRTNQGAVNTQKAMFYKFLEYELQITFNFENFVIFFKIPYSEVRNKYPNLNNDGDVKLSEYEHAPYIIKFLEEYTFGRGIKEI